MKCPNCQETLAMSERQGVEIDFCPKCRGVWLDRGELDKLLEREAALVSGGARSPEPGRYRDDDDDDDHYRGRRSFWREFFD
jgi:Zn-finger nucleic acid-binding protein